MGSLPCLQTLDVSHTSPFILQSLLSNFAALEEFQGIYFLFQHLVSLFRTKCHLGIQVPTITKSERIWSVWMLKMKLWGEELRADALQKVAAFCKALSCQFDRVSVMCLPLVPESKNHVMRKPNQQIHTDLNQLKRWAFTKTSRLSHETSPGPSSALSLTLCNQLTTQCRSLAMYHYTLTCSKQCCRRGKSLATTEVGLEKNKTGFHNTQYLPRMQTETNKLWNFASSSIKNAVWVVFVQISWRYMSRILEMDWKMHHLFCFFTFYSNYAGSFHKQKVVFS